MQFVSIDEVVFKAAHHVWHISSSVPGVLHLI
jgi:hypothetical protein